MRLSSDLDDRTFVYFTRLKSNNKNWGQCKTRELSIIFLVGEGNYEEIGLLYYCEDPCVLLNWNEIKNYRKKNRIERKKSFFEMESDLNKKEREKMKRDKIKKGII